MTLEPVRDVRVRWVMQPGVGGSIAFIILAWVGSVAFGISMFWRAAP